MDERRCLEVLRELRSLAWTCGMDSTYLIASDEVAALDHAIATIERERWRPIAEAPLDGTAILVCYADQYNTNGFLPVAVRWRNYHPNAKGKEAFRDSNGHKVEVVTHWRPLPARPLPDPQPDGQEG